MSVFMAALGAGLQDAGRGLEAERERRAREEEEKKRQKQIALNNYEDSGRWDESVLGPRPEAQGTKQELPDFLSMALGAKPGSLRGQEVTTNKWKEMGTGTGQFIDQSRNPQAMRVRELMAAKFGDRKAINDSRFKMDTESWQALKNDPDATGGDARQARMQYDARQRQAAEQAAEQRAEIEQRSTMLQNPLAQAFMRSKQLDPAQVARDPGMYTAVMNAALRDPKEAGGGDGMGEAAQKMALADRFAGQLFDASGGNMDMAINQLMTVHRGKVEQAGLSLRDVQQALLAVKEQRRALAEGEATRTPGSATMTRLPTRVTGMSGGPKDNDGWRASHRADLLPEETPVEYEEP